MKKLTTLLGGGVFMRAVVLGCSGIRMHFDLVAPLGIHQDRCICPFVGGLFL